MKAFSEAVIRHRKIILLTTLVLCVLSVFAMQGVAVNYNLGPAE
jgi:predicted RND superfamily exporter protein